MFFKRIALLLTTLMFLYSPDAKNNLIVGTKPDLQTLTIIRQSDSAEAWKSRFDEQMVLFDTSKYHYGYSDSSDSAVLAWSGAYVLEGLLRMYEVTLDQKYIAKASTYIDNMVKNLSDKDGDGFVGWGTGKYAGDYTEYIVHYGQVLAPWAEFLLLVKADANLAAQPNPQGITFLKQAEDLKKLIDSQLIARWEPYWSAEYSVYLDNMKEGHSLPHNQYLALASALYMLAKVDVSKPVYLERADKMVKTWRSFLRENSTAYDWNYADSITFDDNWGGFSEDFSHGALDVRAAVMNYNRGGSFTDGEMAKLCSAYYDIMYDGNVEDPGLYNYVSGRDNGKTGEIRLYMYDLSLWQPGIWARGEKHRRINWGTNIINMVDAAEIVMFHPLNEKPEAFTQSCPANGERIQNTPVALLWTPSKNASCYYVEVSVDESFAVKVKTMANIIGNSCIADGLTSNKTYYWRVTAVNRMGQLSTSKVYSFHIV